MIFSTLEKLNSRLNFLVDERDNIINYAERSYDTDFRLRQISHEILNLMKLKDEYEQKLNGAN